jgi:hypothetical protein
MQEKPEIWRLLIDWLSDTFGEGFEVTGTDLIEYRGYILLVAIGRPNLRRGCKHIVCLDDIPIADPEFFEKFKPAVEKRINYLHENYLKMSYDTNS